MRARVVHKRDHPNWILLWSKCGRYWSRSERPLLTSTYASVTCKQCLRSRGKMT